jgi:hypothetical protein
MIRRLLIALLIACLAIPAVASPLHCASQVSSAAMPDGAQHQHGDHHKTPGPVTEMHDCIGCIAPSAGIGAAAEPVWLRAPVPHGRILLPIAGTIRGPDTPPPRA